MAAAQTSEPSPLASVTESIRRIGLKPRKGSTSQSQASSRSHYAGSSGTNESASNSSRPSLTDSGRRRSSLASLSSRLRKGKKQAIGDIQEKHSDERLTLGQRFYNLPAEIQTTILAYLAVPELLSLRLVSKQCLAIFRANASTIARNALLMQASDDECSAYFLVDLYPPLFCSSSTDAYFTRILRREKLVRKQLHILLTFIQTRSYMLKLTRDLACEQFAPYRKGMYIRLYEPVGLAQHYFEIIRHLIIHQHPNHLSPRLTINHCPTCTSTLSTTLASYPSHLLVRLYQTIQLLCKHLFAATRTPSSVTPFERKLRGWSYGPPPEQHMSQLLFLGCLTELCKIDEMHGSYAKRLAIVKQFSDLVADAVRINSLQIMDFYQTETDPIMAAAGQKAKGKTVPSPSKAMRKDMEDVRLALEGRADEHWGVIKSLDIRLDLLTEGMMQSIPALDKFLVGPNTLLGRKIMELGLVDHERELVSPYEFVQRLMAESYEPESQDREEGVDTGEVDDIQHI